MPSERWRRSPEGREWIRVYQREYYRRPEVKARRLAQERARGVAPRSVGMTRREWYVANREEVIARMSERSARMRFGGEPIDWRAYARIRSEPCLSCGRTPSRGVDHLIPLRLGGLHVEENLLPMCRPCNSRKAGRERRAALRMGFATR